MNALYKISATVIIATVFGSMIVLPTFAQTASTTTNTALILQLQAQIADLQAKIIALQKAQNDVAVVSQNIDTTLHLIGQLREGMISDDVALLQKVLAGDPEIYPEGSITGFYGHLTAKAVKKFQKKHGLESVGNVGPKTLALINTMLRDAAKIQDDDNEDEDKHGKGKDLWEKLEHCIVVPPGHLISSGHEKRGHDFEKQMKKWEKKCWKLPWGISKKHHHGATTSTTTLPVADTIAPIVSSISLSGISSTTAMISWGTNEAATSKVYYSATTPFNLGTAYLVASPTLITAHTLSLSGLIASTTYYYVVESKDASNNTATSTQQSFITVF